MSEQNEQQSLAIEFLKSGASIRHFFLSGGVAFNGVANPAKPQPALTLALFQDMREQGLIAQAEDRPAAYPYPYSLYTLTDKGRKAAM